MTAEEALQKYVAKNERQLQVQIVNLLRLKGIEPCWHQTHKQSGATVGWPDITFSIAQTVPNYHTFETLTEVRACAWEVKFGDGTLSKEQEAMELRLTSAPNHWIWRTIRSVDQALQELKSMGI